MISESADVVIIGGGLHGCSIALHLAIRGRIATVIEAERPGRFASGVNAGGVRRLGRHPAEIPLAQASNTMWHDIASLVDDDCGFDPAGQLKIAESELDMMKLEERARDVKNAGFDHEKVISKNKLHEMVPGIHPRAVGGLWCEGDGAANPMRTIEAFHRKAVSMGVRFHTGERVTRVTRSSNEWDVITERRQVSAGIVVNCAGAWGDKVATWFGDRIELEAQALTMMVTERVQPFLRPVCGLTSGKLSFKQTEEGTFLIGGGHTGYADRDRGLAEPDPVKMAVSAAIVSDIFPFIRHLRVARCWAGLEGVTPDNIPVIGPGQNAENAFHAFGFSGHGFQLGPIVGRLMADLICDGHTNFSIEPFSANRFAIVKGGYLPMKSGFRFSLNDATPS